MSYATLRFKLPEEEVEFIQATKAGDMHSALFGIVETLRDRVKYGELESTGYDELVYIRDRILGIIEDNGVDPYEL